MSVLALPRADAAITPSLAPALGRPRWLRRQVLLLVGLDLLAGVVGSLGVVVLRYHAAPAALAGVDYRLLAVLVVPLWTLVLAGSGGYEPRVLGVGTEEFRRVASAGVRLLAALVLVSFLAKVDLSRSVVAGGMLAVLMLTLLVRWAARRALHALRRRGHCLHRVVVVGAEPAVRGLLRTLRRAEHAGLRVVGVCTPAGTGWLAGGAADARVPVLGRPAAAGAAAAAVGADTVAVAGDGQLGEDGLRRLAWSLEGRRLDLLVAPGLTDVAGPRIVVRPVDGVPLLHVEEPELSGPKLVLKGAFDRSLAVVLLVVLAPVLVIIALALRCTSPGTTVFSQVRVGRNGREFRIYKFRTMVADAPAALSSLSGNDANGPLFKLRTDPRVTPLGRVLRRWSLDELPQLLNVVTGSMSLVGPRPPLPSEVERYGDDVRRRLLVKPGLTGLWQVSGRSDLSWEDSVRLDLHYVENWSPTLDLLILARTVLAVGRGAGAY